MTISLNGSLVLDYRFRSNEHMIPAFHTALIFLIDTLFNLYLFVLTIRLLLAWVHADYFNPFTQFIGQLTNVIVKPLRRYIHSTRRIEMATLLLIFVIECIKFFLVACIGFGLPHFYGLPILAVADMIALIIQVYTYAILLQIILSFIQPYSDFMSVVLQLTSPMMSPLRRFIPLVGNIDITPIPALILLQLANIVVVSPLMRLGQNIVFG